MKKLTYYFFIGMMGFSSCLEPAKEAQDLSAEIQEMPWLRKMKPGADYFAVKAEFDQFLAEYRPADKEESQPISFGGTWLKTRLFYLDKAGNVQTPPPFTAKHFNNSLPPNEATGTTTREVGSWRMIGPVNISSKSFIYHVGYMKQSVSHDHGGYATLVRIDPTNTDKMFVSFNTGGLWMTEDKGESWTLTDATFPDDTYRDIDVCIKYPQTVYALSARQLLRSTDGGLNWKPTTMTKENYSGFPYDLAASPTDPDVVVVRFGTSVYRTTDGGTAWDKVLSVLPQHRENLEADMSMNAGAHSETLDWSTTEGDVVYLLDFSHSDAYDSVHVYRSEDQGTHFSKMTSITSKHGPTKQKVTWGKLLLPANSPSSIYVILSFMDEKFWLGSGAQLHQLHYRSGQSQLQRAINEKSLYAGDFSMDRLNKEHIVFGGYMYMNVLVSTNSGQTFKLSQDMHFDIRSIDVIGDYVLTGNDGEVVLSEDGGLTHKTISNSISNHELWGFGAAFKTNVLATGNNHGPVMIKETKDGFDWQPGTGGDMGNTDVNPLDDRYVYCSDIYGDYRFFRDKDRQDVFKLIPRLSLSHGYAFNSMEFHPNLYYTMFTPHSGRLIHLNRHNIFKKWQSSLVKSEDNGNTISMLKTFKEQVLRVKICMGQPKHMYVVVKDYFSKKSQLWYTHDGGSAWQDITPSTAASEGWKIVSDVAVSDVNPKEVWLTYGGVQTECKVLKSKDAGKTWTNLTQPILTEYPNTKIIFQRGTEGGVYVGNKSGIYYRNDKMTNWEKLGNGLPMMDVRFLFINYNRSKLLLGGSRGAWEHDLYEIAPPKAQISASTNKVLCPVVNKVQFKDYSTVRNASATWRWKFPGGVPNTSTDENPLVSYANAPKGTYDVTLTVADAHGTDTQTLSDFVEVLNCGESPTPEGVSGHCLALKKYTEMSTMLRIAEGNSVTSSFWFKPNIAFNSNKQIFSISMEQAIRSLSLSPDNELLLREGQEESFFTGLHAPIGKWSYVVLVSNGYDVTIYLNGKPSSVKKCKYPVSPPYIFASIGSEFLPGRYLIDELTFWDRALSADEIRKWKHLIKNKAHDPILKGMVGYYQFNRLESFSDNLRDYEGLLWNNIQSNHASFTGEGYSQEISTAPLFEGVSEKHTVTTAGKKDFTQSGLSMTFSSGKNPNGDVWVSRAFQSPDNPPDDGFLNAYWVVDNYGTNQAFAPLEQLAFYKNPALDDKRMDFTLFQRGSNAFGDTWGSTLDVSDAKTGEGRSAKVSFSDPRNITSLGQFTLSRQPAPPTPPDPTPPSPLTPPNPGKPEKEPSVLSILGKEVSTKPFMYPIPLRKQEALNVVIPDTWGGSTLFIIDAAGKRCAVSSLKVGKNQLLLSLPAGKYVINIVNQRDAFSSNILIE